MTGNPQETSKPHQWKWTPESESDILLIYYIYVLEASPPVYRLYLQTRDGCLEPVSIQEEKNFKFDSDRRAITMAKAMRQEIPVPVSQPVKSRERGPSCSIC